MKDHIAAVKALLEPWGHKVYFGDVPASPTYPYALLWSSAGNLTADEADGVQDDLNELLGVTVAAETAEAALFAVPPVRALLLGKVPVVEGWHTQPLRLFDSQAVQVDKDVALPGTNRHPAFVVDQYRLISEPLEDA